MSRQLHHRILIGPNGETYHPTLKAPASFNAEEDCKKLRAAMKGLGKLYFVRVIHYIRKYFTSSEHLANRSWCESVVFGDYKDLKKAE